MASPLHYHLIQLRVGWGSEGAVPPPQVEELVCSQAQEEVQRLYVMNVFWV